MGEAGEWNAEHSRWEVAVGGERYYRLCGRTQEWQIVDNSTIPLTAPTSSPSIRGGRGGDVRMAPSPVPVSASSVSGVDDDDVDPVEVARLRGTLLPEWKELQSLTVEQLKAHCRERHIRIRVPTSWTDEEARNKVKSTVSCESVSPHDKPEYIGGVISRWFVWCPCGSDGVRLRVR